MATRLRPLIAQRSTDAPQTGEAWSRYHQLVTQKPHVTRTLPIKAPGPNGEKGVILTYFEYNWLRLLRGIADYASFSRRWSVIFCSSWSPTDYSLVARAIAMTDGPVYVQPCNFAEAPKLKRFHPKVKAVPGMPCDWLCPEHFSPLPWSERDVDLLIVSNWAPFKRHWELFETLRRMPANLKVVCIGQPELGHTLAGIKKLQEAFQVPQQIEYVESIPIDQVTQYQCRAKIALIFSRWEGCCVAAAEALFAGAVLAMRKDAYVGPKSYINSQTGILLEPGRAHEQLMEALRTGEKYRSRAWAEANISCYQTNAKLSAMLEEDAREAGQPWTIPTIVPCWRPYPRICHAADAPLIQAACAELHQNYPNVFPADLQESSWR